VVSADGDRSGVVKTEWLRSLAEEAKMFTHYSLHEPYKAPRGPTSQLIDWVPSALLLVILFSYAAIIATILVLFVML
jgi:hypothetical protein